MRIRNHKNRSGLTLIFVVSMIVLFLLMGTTFVVIANDYFRAARKRSKANLYTIDHTAIIHRAAYDLFRGPSLLNQDSPFRGQDLLSDQYGYGFKGFVNGFEDTMTPEIEVPSLVAGGNFVQITVRSDTASNAGVLDFVFTVANPDLAATHLGTGAGTTSGLYNGRVLTFTAGDARGVSTRIVNHIYVPSSPTAGHHYFWIVPTWRDRGSVPIADLVGDEFVINGREFSGTGAGGTSASLTNRLTNEALLPNRIGESLVDFRTTYLGGLNTIPNETYDAADYQNMYLSGRDSFGNIIPSFHRHSLYKYVYDNIDGVQSPTTIREYSFRPVFRDEVDNTTLVAPGDGIPDAGSTANSNFIYNRFVDPSNLVADPAAVLMPGEQYVSADLEVDNDGDGNFDSVFIDAGLGVITDHHGKRFKPLVAYHVADMDGRLNLNAHGNLTQVAGNSFFISTSAPLLGGASVATLPRGSGYGPPDVDLNGLFAGSLGSILSSRYGADGVPGSSATRKSTKKLFGHPVETVDWANGNFGTVSREFSLSGGVFTADTTRPGSLFASSAMDIHSRLGIATPAFAAVNTAVAFDNFRDLNYTATFPNGLPGIDMLASASTAYEFDNNPYEMSFAPLPYGDPSDDPYSASELERVLRQFDVDSAVLPDRLWNDATTVWTGVIGNKNLVTTDSFEVPVLYENFKLQLVNVLQAAPHNLATADAIARADLMIAPAANMFAPELMLGLKMNVNRPLGNGYDDDSDGVVDEPDEADFEFNRDYDNLAFDLNHDLVAASGEGNARVLFARHLYMLALLVCDPIDVDLDGDGNPDPDSFEKVIAQWAINTVDFRDPDSIMTQFDYDPNPWDGTWNPLTDGTNTVWGCERPELLISETFAFHDRRNEDTAAHGGNTPTDNDYDSRLRPEAGAFIELYNPWTQNSLNQRFDESLYVYSGNSFNQGVDLTRKSAGAAGSNAPVWRVAVERPDRSGTFPETTTPLRYVYFTDPIDGGNDNITDDDGAGVEVFYSDLAGIAVRPGEQAVIGSVGHEDTAGGIFRVPMGRLATKTNLDENPDNLDLANTRSIILDPANEIVTRFPADTTVPANERNTRILQINLPRSFNVSDPFGGYNASGAMLETPIADGVVYTGGFDEPLDADATGDANRDDDDLQYVWLNGQTGGSFRVIKLQRLANPLLPFDATTNPYLTIDRTDMDLTGFNGVIPPAASGAPAPDLAGITLTGAPVATVVDNNVSLERGEGDADRLLFQSSRQATIAPGTPGTGDHYFDMILDESLGKTNDAYITNATTMGFAWLTWNNRPYVSHLELANVPFAEPKWLTRNFSDLAVTSPYAGNDDELRGRFRHLLNFFTNDTDASADRANLYRLMDYLEVPSRFVGTEQQLDPTTFPAPFDSISRFRVPGKINLNTIYANDTTPAASTIWNALQGQYTTLGCSFANFRDSRENLTGSMPTDFGNPFRPAGQGDNVPLDAPTVTDVGSTIFRDGTSTTIGAGEPLFDFVSTTSAYNSARSAYFRNAQRQRLGNLVTTKSSVFAVWVTVAYFEVDDAGRVGAEIGSDTGEITRNRGFYIFDRSIPVGFEPGKNHNIERAILVQSIIE